MVRVTSASPGSSQDAGAMFDDSLPYGPDDVRWQALELEMAREQLQVLRDSIAQASERIDLLNSELRMLPWNWARLVRDARFALAAGRAAMESARQETDGARQRLQRASDELAAAEAQLIAADSDRRSTRLGLLMRRRRRHDGALLDLRMNQALANEQLQTALEHLHRQRTTVESREQSLGDLLAGRRRQRSILIEEIESLGRRLQFEQAQCQDYLQIVTEFEAALNTADEDSTAPA